MLTVFCYVTALVLFALAATMPNNVPRDRLAYAALCLWLLPTAVHVLQAH